MNVALKHQQINIFYLTAIITKKPDIHALESWASTIHTGSSILTNSLLTYRFIKLTLITCISQIHEQKHDSIGHHENISLTRAVQDNTGFTLDQIYSQADCLSRWWSIWVFLICRVYLIHASIWIRHSSIALVNNIYQRITQRFIVKHIYYSETEVVPPSEKYIIWLFLTIVQEWWDNNIVKIYLFLYQ